jgi:hypothetical protein
MIPKTYAQMTIGKAVLTYRSTRNDIQRKGLAKFLRACRTRLIEGQVALRERVAHSFGRMADMHTRSLAQIEREVSLIDAALQ